MTTREKTPAGDPSATRALDPRSRVSTPVPARSYQASKADTDAGREYESITERTARIEHKVVVAQLLIERLSPSDGRARLLASGVLRRDEVLLDAILGQMTGEIAALAEPQKLVPRRR